ncbi:GntR family transcriptional regulator [Rhodococcus sp. Z13]|uniref:GntR family transcriptional regulator n=1 Tax=Rhodococcus sacchari TaxID=2962047 RepID=A0ACD4DI02_9NOCA|nr:GntR family transcriptional regulator [Rhodococcus sp. Z13]UYP19658.1 GntR family transcriptional regulator [Rhodococcus sp. Z13]
MPPRRRSILLDRLRVDAPGRPQDAILDELRRAFLSGAAPPGTPIPVGDIAELFGVSRIPVREALKTLIGEGLVSHRRNHGYTVAQLTAAELRELYLVRETLESASLAAAVRNATEEDDRRVRETHAILEKAVLECDSLTYHRESRTFHMALTRPSRMHRLLHMLDYTWNMTEPVQPMVHVGDAERAELHHEHEVMLEAFLARDTEALLAASEHHNRRLDEAIAGLSVEAGLLAADEDDPLRPEDIQFG